MKFGLAQVAQTVTDIAPALDRALEHRPEPNGSFARRPSTASLILSNERRSTALPVWRLRTVRAALAGTAAVIIASWTLTTGASYSLVSHFVHMRPVTAVATTRPEVGVLVDAPASEIPTIANDLAERGIRASFAMEQAAYPAEPVVVAEYGDQAVPRLPDGGLVRWIGARDRLHDLMGLLGYGHHFLYVSSGPSVGQWVMAHGAGGRLVAGAVRLQDPGRPGRAPARRRGDRARVHEPFAGADASRQARPGSADLPPEGGAGRSAHTRRRLVGLGPDAGSSV